MYPTPRALILAQTENGAKVCASAGRISTQEGPAISIYEKAAGAARDQALVKKVLSSGHQSVVEHHCFSIAFENVSVLVEQFLIEFRLASFTVKSRRYVNFQNAGFYTPEKLSGPARALYEQNMRARFEDYARLLECEIPREDARFVLPYCFLSNFYVSCNARELMHIIWAMLHGRGRAYAELADLGGQLSEQFEKIYPGVLSQSFENHPQCAARPFQADFCPPHVDEGRVSLISAPADEQALLRAALDFGGRFDTADLSRAVRALVRDARARELECLNYTFLMENLSLSAVTHLARHRIQSPVFEPVWFSLRRGGYVLPATVAANDTAREVYVQSFERNYHALKAMREYTQSEDVLSYFALSGGMVNALVTMNARELAHFIRLRACNRAQWEIRAFTQSLLEQLRERAGEIFDHFGPSCEITGRCPEGRLSCGRVRHISVSH